MKWVLGIDGGGTKTEAFAANLNGDILGSIVLGSSNYQLIGLEGLKQMIYNLLKTISDKLHLDIHDLEILSLGLAGLDRDNEKSLILNKLTELGLNCRYLVYNDAKISLIAGLDHTVGLTVISGTGSIAYGINAEGEEIRAGGWGHILGDEGSGYEIGRKGLSAAIKSVEKRGEETVLMDLILAELVLQDPSELIQYIYSDLKNKGKIASLATVVTMAASLGDKVSIDILRECGEELARLALSVIERGFKNKYKGCIVINGSILKNVELIREVFTEIIIRNHKDAQIILPKNPAAMGAVILALEEIQKMR